MSDKDFNVGLLIMAKASLNIAKGELEKIIDRYILENNKLDILKNLKEELISTIDTLSSQYEVQDEKIDYKYSGEIVKIYNKKTGIGITILAEFMGENLTNIEGFCLDFNNLEIEDLNEEDVKTIYSIVVTTQDPKSIEEKVCINSYSNRELCNLNYTEIRKKFITKSKIEEMSKYIKEDEEEPEI